MDRVCNLAQQSFCGFPRLPSICTRPSTFGMIDFRELQPLFFKFSSLKGKSAAFLGGGGGGQLSGPHIIERQLLA